MKKTILVTALATASFVAANAQTSLTPANFPGVIVANPGLAGGFQVTADLDLGFDGEYILEAPTFVTGGATLTIGEGTIVRGQPEDLNANTDPGTLVITREGSIQACGTPSNPIIFTTAADVNGGTWQSGEAFLDADPKANPLPLDKGLWGAVTILGNAPINTGAIDTGIPGEAFIEGFPEDPAVVYGGCDVWDNSGVFKFVSIRYSGKTVVDGDEQQGITLGGVGAGTQLEFVETFGSDDDSIEIFGGTAEIRNFVLIGSDDDGFDADHGWQGNAQFVLIVNAYAGYNSDHALEVDGDDTGDLAGDEDNISKDGRPFASGCLTNFTVVGIPQTGQDIAARFRRGFGGAFVNSLFCGFSDQIGLRIDNNGGVLADGTNLPVDCGYKSIAVQDRVVDGSFIIAGVNFFDAGTGGNSAFEDSVIANTAAPTTIANQIGVDPEFGQVGIGFFASDNGGCELTDIQNGTFNPVPNPAVDAGWGSPVEAGNIFEDVTYRGAFQPLAAGASLWTTGWTALNVSGVIVSVNP